MNRIHRHLSLSLLLLAASAGCPHLPPDSPDGECLCLGDQVCVETDSGSICADPCEAAGDCDTDHTCLLDVGACVIVCAPAGPGCHEGEACVDAGPVNICAPEMGP